MTHISHQLANPYPRRSMEWLYEEIMRHIEPDLTLQRFHKLDKLYATETKKERGERLHWYESAFALYDRIFADVAAMYAKEGRAQKHAVRKKTGAQEHTERSTELQDIERIIDSHLSDA